MLKRRLYIAFGVVVVVVVGLMLLKYSVIAIVWTLGIVFNL